MPARSTDDLRSMIGDSVRTVAGFTIERGKVAEFSHAIKDPNPLFLSADAAMDAGHPAIVAPPTFTRVAYFPHNRTGDGEPNFGFDLGFDRSKTVHGEQEYEYARPAYVGDTLSGTTTLTNVYERTGAVRKASSSLSSKPSIARNPTSGL
jgi:peroxisomal enoyl-CoA hydratase 2